MDKIVQYQDAIIDLLHEHMELGNPDELFLITDREHNHFQILTSGWQDEDNFTMGILLHFQIKPDGKIWVLANWTEDDVAMALVNRGVPKSDIVLGFHPQYVRKYTGYAVA
jgi:XisI protein